MFRLEYMRIITENPWHRQALYKDGRIHKL